MTDLKTGMVKEDTRTPGLQRVKEKLRLLSMTQEDRRAYDHHMDNIMVQNDVLDNAREEGREEGLAEGREEGRAEGRIEEKIEITKQLIALGLSDEVFVQSTNSRATNFSHSVPINSMLNLFIRMTPGIKYATKFYEG